LLQFKAGISLLSGKEQRAFITADMLERLHTRLDPLGAVSKKMFGGVCFMLHGNMVAGTSKRGMLVRAGKGFGAIAAGRKECQPMEMGGRVMEGYWFVEEEADAAAFDFWMEAALAFNKTLPPK
jgi:TfoX/Sxy family transcriptional regulator of competence genes